MIELLKHPHLNIMYVNHGRSTYNVREVKIYNKEKVVYSFGYPIDAFRNILPLEIGYDKNSLNFIGDTKDYKLKRRKEEKFDGQVFFLKQTDSYSYRDDNEAVLYLPLELFKVIDIKKLEDFYFNSKRVYHKVTLEYKNKQFSFNDAGTTVELTSNCQLKDDVETLIRTLACRENDDKLYMSTYGDFDIDEKIEHMEAFIKKYKGFKLQR